MAAGLPAGLRDSAVDRRALRAALSCPLRRHLLELRPVRSPAVAVDPTNIIYEL